jgi:hypothetical protein
MEYTQGHIEETFIRLRKALNKLYEDFGGEDEE